MISLLRGNRRRELFLAHQRAADERNAAVDSLSASRLRKRERAGRVLVAPVGADPSDPSTECQELT